MEDLKTNNDIYQLLGSITEGIRGINTHLSTLNGSVAKLQDKANQNDVINAQMTITQQQLVTELGDMKKDKKSMSTFWYGVLSSIGVGIVTYLLTK